MYLSSNLYACPAVHYLSNWSVRLVAHQALLSAAVVAVCTRTHTHNVLMYTQASHISYRTCSLLVLFTLHAQLLAMGVPSFVLGVSAANAVEFRFEGQLFFSASVLAGQGVRVGDGAVLHLGEDGCAGAGELER